MEDSAAGEPRNGKGNGKGNQARTIRMRIFVAGIMQGSHLGAVLHSQSYRDRLRDLLSEHFPGAEVYDPLADHQDSLDYDEARGRQVFMKHNAMCGEVDLVLAYVPEASMGTAIEMWEAYRQGRVVLCISPLEHNWAIRFCSHAVYPDFESFATALAAGDVQRRVAEVRQ